jgi:hypothetical protein
MAHRGDAMQFCFAAYPSKQELYRMRIPLPVRVLCGVVIGIAGWSAMKASVQKGASASKVSVPIASQASGAPNLGKAAPSVRGLL